MHLYNVCKIINTTGKFDTAERERSEENIRVFQTSAGRVPAPRKIGTPAIGHRFDI